MSTTEEVTRPTSGPSPEAATADPGGDGDTQTRRRLPLNAKLAPFILLPTLVGAIVLLGWWFVHANELVSPLLLPGPSEVWTAFDYGVIEGTWWVHIETTLLEVVLGFGIGVVGGLAIGALFAFVNPVRIALYPYIIATQSFPKLAIAPLLVVILGYGIGPKVLVAALLAYFPVMTAAFSGFTEINKDEHNLMRSVGASRWQEMRYLRLPNAMSYLFPALDVALISALLGAVGAELVGAKAGLGSLLMQRQAFGDTASIFAIIFVLIIIGLLLRACISLVRAVLPRSILPR